MEEYREYFVGGLLTLIVQSMFVQVENAEMRELLLRKVHLLVFAIKDMAANPE